MRFRVGFFTARHPEIDGPSTSSCYAYLAIINLNAQSRGEAAEKAKARVDRDLLQRELRRRYPNATAVNYTIQHLSKKAPKTWGRSFERMELK